MIVVTIRLCYLPFLSQLQLLKKAFYQDKAGNATYGRDLFLLSRISLTDLHSQLPLSPLMTLQLSLLKMLLPYVRSSPFLLNVFNLIELILPSL